MVNIFLPNLTQLAVVKIATVLWNNVDKHPRRFKIQIMKLKVRKLQMPDILKLEIENFIDEMLRQIRNWEYFHLFMLNNSVQMPLKYNWTSYGTIDSKETIKATMKYSTADSLGKYRIACIQCVEDDIVLLKKELESEGKDLQWILHNGGHICVYWSLKVTNNLDRLSCYAKWYSGRDDATPCEVALEYAAKGGFDVATRFFFEILNTESKQKILENIARRIVKFNIPNVTVLVIFLSNMSREKQLKVFKGSYHNVLISLLNWPRNDLFLEVASYMWEILSQEGYYHVLQSVLTYLKGTRSENLFNILWQMTSQAWRNKLLTMFLKKQSLLDGLYESNRKETVKNIFRYASTEEKLKIIFSDEGLSFCELLICYYNPQKLDFFVRQCVSSKTDILKLSYALISVTKNTLEKAKIKKLFSTLI